MGDERVLEGRKRDERKREETSADKRDRRERRLRCEMWRRVDKRGDKRAPVEEARVQ